MPLRDPAELRQTYHLAIGYVAGSDVEVHGQQMMLAQRPDAHAADHDQLVAQTALGEARRRGRRFGGEKITPPRGDPVRRVHQSVPCGVFTECGQELADEIGDALGVDRPRRGGLDLW